MWCTANSVFFVHQGSTIVSVKKFFQKLVQSQWGTMDDHPSRAWVKEVQEAKKIHTPVDALPPLQTQNVGFFEMQGAVLGV